MYNVTSITMAVLYRHNFWMITYHNLTKTSMNLVIFKLLFHIHFFECLSF